MALNPERQQPRTDIADLWITAVGKYNQSIDHDTKDKGEFRIQRDIWTIATMEAKMEKELAQFNSWRNPNTSLARIRSVLTQVVAAAQEAIGPVVSLVACAYPPASAISQALFFVFQVCKRVSGRYDEIATFYQTIQFFFERLSLLHRRLPQENAFGEPITRVFIAILEMLHNAKKYALRGRAVVFIREVISKDDGLANAYANFTRRMNDLESSVIVATLGTVTEASRDLKQVREMIRVLNLIMTTHRPDRIQVGESRPGSQSEPGDGGMWAMQRRGMIDMGSRKFNVFEYVLTRLSTGAEVPLRQWLNEMDRCFVQGTCGWIEEAEVFKKVLDQKSTSPIVIKGEPGTGKTMLAFYIFCSLKHHFPLNSQASAAYFSFSTESGKLWSVRDMVCACAMQVAEENESYRKDLVKIISKKPDYQWPKGLNADDCWNSLFMSVFSGQDPRGRLVLVLDGVDQMEEDEVNELQKLLQTVKDKDTFQFILVLRDGLDTQGWGNIGGKSIIDLNKENLDQDIRIFTEARMKTLKKLDRCSEKSRKSIVDHMCKKQNFLYADHSLHRLNISQGVVRAQLPGLPGTVDEIYKDLFQQLRTGRDDVDIMQLHGLFTWLAWTKERLTLGAAERLIELVAELEPTREPRSKRRFSIETKMKGRLSRLLTLSANPSDQVTEDEDEDLMSFLGLSAPSLRTFYRDNDHVLFPDTDQATALKCRAPKYRAHILMFRMMTSVLTMLEGNNLAEKELILYASSSWHKYLKDPKDPSQEEIKCVVEALYDVFENINGALRRLESRINVNRSNHHRIYEGADGLREMISKWVKMAETSERDEINTFIESVRTDPGGLAKYIAERHVASWWTARYPIEAYTSFRLAHQALFDAGSGDVSETDWNAAGEKEIYDQFIRVSNAFDQRSPETKDGKIHAQRLRCRSMALRYDGLYKRAIDDIDKAINSKPDREEKLKLFDRRGRIYFGWAEDVEDDIHNGDSITKGDESQEERRKKYLTEANKAFDEVLGDSTLWKEQMNMTYQLKAKTEALLGNMEQCLRTIGEASALDPQPLIYFDNIVARIMISNGDERVTRIQTLLEKVPKGQLAAGCTGKTHELLQHAASKSEDHTRLLSEMYKEAVKALKAHHEGASVNSMRIWRALFAQQVEKNIEKAKKDLQKALIPKVASDINAITLASWRLADILLQEFWNPEHRTDQKLTPCDILAAREEVRCQMTQLVRTINVQVPEFQPELSQTSIPLAMMQHELGPKVTFKKEVDAIFTACCEALNDNLASNDSPSLQMLAKVLSLLPGLTSHAQTAFTCQFYIIDEEQHRQEVAKADAAPKNGPGPGSARSKGKRDRSYGRRATAPIKHDMSISRSTDNYHRKQSVKQTILGGSVVNNAYSSQRKRNVTRHESSSNRTSGSQQVNQQVTFKEPDVSSTPADVFTQTSVQCSSCRKSIHRGNLQEEKAFLCYFCTNTIFCGDCYNSHNTRNGQSEHMPCQTYHQHIKAPVCNWKELAEGRLILEGKETPFKDWLASLKTAWEEEWEKCLRLPSDSEARPTYF